MIWGLDETTQPRHLHGTARCAAHCQPAVSIIRVYIRSVVVGGGWNPRTDLTDRQKRQSAVAAGVAMGVGLGLALDNILLGISFGILIGTGLAATPK